MQKLLREHIERRVPLTDEEFSYVLNHVNVQKFKKRQFLFKEGDSVPYMFFVVSGLLKLVYTAQTGKQHLVSFAMEDWWECDFEAFFAKTKATMSLDCLEDTVVCCLSLENLQSLRDNLPKIERFFLSLSTRGHSALQRRLLSLMTIQVKERYEQLIAQYPSLIQRVPKTLLASYLGVSRETMSRLSKREKYRTSSKK